MKSIIDLVAKFTKTCLWTSFVNAFAKRPFVLVSACDSCLRKACIAPSPVPLNFTILYPEPATKANAASILALIGPTVVHSERGRDDLNNISFKTLMHTTIVISKCAQNSMEGRGVCVRVWVEPTLYYADVAEHSAMDVIGSNCSNL